MREVFISYKSNDPALGNNDETVANELCKAIEAAGISCWIAPRDIEPGVRYGRAIMEAINSCKVMVVVFSEHANLSEHIANEVDAVFARKVDIIPFNLDCSKPGLEFEYYLRRMQWVDAHGDYRQKIPELIDALKHKLGKQDDGQRDNGQTIIVKAPVEQNVDPKEPARLTFNVNGVSIKMIRVEGGTFMMGATPEQGGDACRDEKPAHQVTLSTYHIGETLVTQELWQAVMGKNPSHFKGDLQRPVEKISWPDCQDFIIRLSHMTGRLFRLPTEAEWEFAARGGNMSKGYKYAGSSSPDEVAWYSKNSNWKTHPVGRKKANELGLFDMSGNVFEWCQDWLKDYTSEPQTNPIGPSYGSYRVERGGSCGSIASDCRVSYRTSSEPSVYLGLRLAL